MGEEHYSLAGLTPTAGISPRRKSKLGTTLLIIVVTLALLFPLIAAILIRFFVAQSLTLPGASMEPTIPKGSIVIADIWVYRAGDPQRNDIAAFRYPLDPETQYMKRVIGLPGEILEITDGKLMINGEPLDCSFFKEEPVSDFGPVEIPSGQYFVIGDNFNHSSDSRVWGFVPRDLFISRYWFRLK